MRKNHIINFFKERENVKIIDVSKHNGDIDWAKVKAEGIDGVVIRAGYGKHVKQKDPCFEANYSEAKAVGLNVGAYWYSYAVTVAEAKLEAITFLEVLKGKKFELPVYFDIEEERQVKLGKALCTAITSAFCSEVEKAGYYTGIYSFDSFFATNLDKAVTSRYTCWIARIGGTPSHKHDMWQYSWKERINGIIGDVDANHCYKDFPRIIRNAGLSGYGYITTYNINAVINGIDKDNADKIAAECSKMGMTVVVKEVKNER